MPSIRQVAKKAGVSIATVSRVMNGSESVAPHLRDKVKQAIEVCDYTPKVGLRSPDSIALIYTGLFTVGSPYDSACIDGMVEAMRETSYDLAIVDLQRDLAPRESLRQFFARKGIRGGVLRCTAEERSAVAGFGREGLSLVVLGDHFDCEDLSFVYADSQSASREAVEHLVSLGHERIAFASCERDDGDHADRLSVYRGVLDSHGLLDSSLIYQVPPHRFDGVQLIRNLLGKPDRPTAIFIADPLVAVGAINEAHRIGVRIPEELSIIGVDDTDIRGSVFPRMSAVCQDSKRLGYIAFHQAIGPREAGPRTRPPAQQQAWLDLGSTTGPPPARTERVLPTGARLPT